MPRIPDPARYCLPVLLAATLGGCAPSAPPSADTPPPVSVQTATATEQDVPIVLSTSGSILADEVTDVAARISGVVADTPVDIGASLAAGDVIVVLDDTEARLRRAQAEAAVTENDAALESARAAEDTAQGQARLATENAQSLSDLFDKGGISRNQYEQAQQQMQAALDAAEAARLRVVSAQAALDSARAQAQLAQQAVEHCLIRAPFAGFLSRRSANQGEFVADGSSVAQVLRLDPVRVVAQIPEAQMPLVETGLQATARVAAYPGKTFAGRIVAVSPAVDERSRAATAIIAFPNADSQLRPGMFASVTIAQTKTEKALFVPSAAVMTDADTSTTQVFAVRNGTATLLVVQAGATSGDRTRIINGVAAGEVVATSNLAELRDGAKVTTGS